MSYRFAAPELLRLGPPPPLAASDFESLNSQSLADLLARFNTAGIAYDVSSLQTDPAVILTQSAAYRDLLRRHEIDDAVAQTYLGSAIDAMLDQRAADYGVLRRVVQFADPFTGAPEIKEDDDSLRLRARLAWEALSVAGPVGAYVFHTLDAHPGAFDAKAYGPESGFVSPGEVLVVVQGRDGNGVPSDGVIDAVAARLDARFVVYGNNTTVDRTVRDLQAVRPLGAKVTVVAAQALTYDVTATLYVDPHGDREVIRAAALTSLQAYQESRRRIGSRVPKSGLEAALALVSQSGVPVVDDVDVVESDVIPSHLQIPVPGEVNITVVVR